jgi:hypothetical protein
MSVSGVQWQDCNIAARNRAGDPCKVSSDLENTLYSQGGFFLDPKLVLGVPESVAHGASELMSLAMGSQQTDVTSAPQSQTFLILNPS